MSNTIPLTPLSEETMLAMKQANDQWLEAVQEAGLPPVTILSNAASLACIVGQAWTDANGSDGLLAIMATIDAQRTRHMLKTQPAEGSA